MFAVVRESHYDPDKLRQGQAQMEEFRALQERQPGYAGSVVVDAGNGRTLSVALWESEAQQQAASTVLRPEADRLLAPMYAAPRQVIAQGPVLRSDLAKT
jgi:hypothetical protein